TRGAQGLDDPEGQATAAVHGDARRLVEHQQPFITMQDARFHAAHERGRDPTARPGRSASRLQANRRYAHAIAGAEALLGTVPAAVDAHLSAPDQAEQAAARHARQQPTEHLVQPLALLLGADLDLLNRRARLTQVLVSSK